MISSVNKEIGEAVKVALKQRGMTQRQLADDLGMKHTNLSNMLAGRGSEVPKRWQEILDRLNLELTVQPTRVSNESASRTASAGAEGES